MNSGPAPKLACPYKGPYRIVELHPNGAEVLMIDQPKSPAAIRVALNRIRRDPVADLPPPEEDPCSELDTTVLPSAPTGSTLDPDTPGADPEPPDVAPNFTVPDPAGKNPYRNEPRGTVPGTSEVVHRDTHDGLLGTHTSEDTTSNVGMWKVRLRPRKNATVVATRERES